MANLDAVLMVIDKYLEEHSFGEYDYYTMQGFKEYLKAHYNEYFSNLSYQEVAARLNGLELKSPLIALLLSLALGIFGVGRFYAGHYKYGIVKLMMLLIAVIAFILQYCFFGTEFSDESVLLFLGGAAMYASAISYFIDMFTIRKRIIRQNTEWIQNTIIFGSKINPSKKKSSKKNNAVGQACG